MLTPTKKLLQKADRRHYAVPAFNINNLEVLQGILQGATQARSPVIVQTSSGAIEYAGMEALGALVQALARPVRIPVAFHFDHGKNMKQVVAAIKSGYYQSVMYDGSHLPYFENVANTRKVVALAHKRALSVEAELGAIAGSEDHLNVSEKKARFTNPQLAQDFVARTGCDFLAISIGTSHGAYKFEGKSYLDFARLKQIEHMVKIPLVLHGASGVPESLLKRYQKLSPFLHDQNRLATAHGVADNHIRRAVKMGIDKVNIDTDLRIAFLVAVREKLVTDHTVIDPRQILTPARELIARVVEAKARLLGSAGKA